MTCDGDPSAETLVDMRFSKGFGSLRSVPLIAMVGAFDVHRKQITFDYVDDGGVVHSSEILPAISRTLRS